MKREFLMLAHKYIAQPVGGWYWSEKLDGARAYWDSGLTRGLPTDKVPFANTTKDARYVVQPKATGLWSRYGKPIQAPDWWLDLMPPFPLDGELFIDRGLHQLLMSTIKTLVPGPDWRSVKYMAFDTPPYHVIFSNGEIDNVNFKKTFTNIKIGREYNCPKPSRWDFHNVYSWLRDTEQNDVFRVHAQHHLPTSSRDAVAYISATLNDLTSQGAEGLMLRNPASFWAPQRAKTLLKVKGYDDAEGTVIGYTWGRETDRGSKLLGKMGALVVRYKDKVFELSGFTDDERRMSMTHSAAYNIAFEIGCQNPGGVVPDDVYNPQFPRGSIVSFRYRELTDAGIPKEARYWRKRSD